jgi:hypothetical protein
LTDKYVTEINQVIFSADVNGLNTITLINREPLLKILNKVGMPLLEIDANGSIKSTVITTNDLILNPVNTSVINNTLTNYALYSTIGNLFDNQI